MFGYFRRGVEQLVARVAHTHQVTGSSPVPTTMVWEITWHESLTGRS